MLSTKLVSMKRFNIISALCVAIGFTSCDLDLTPMDQISDASYWTKSEDFRLATNNLYWGLADAFQFDDNHSDIAYGKGADDISNGSYIAPVSDEEWDKTWEQIHNANYILERAESSTLPESEIGRWIGETRFFRAYNYWKMMKKFGGVPKIEIALTTESPELYAERATQQEIADFILSDLDKAIPVLPKQSNISSDEMGRVSQGAALLLKARTALYQGTWEKYHDGSNADKYLTIAINAAQTLIDSHEYDLYKGMGDDSYKYLFILQGDDSEEVILAKRYYKLRLTHNWSRELLLNAMTPTKNMADLYLCQDGLPIEKSSEFRGYETMTSEFENRDPRMPMTFVVPGSEVFIEGGIWAKTYPGFLGSNATHTGYLIRKFMDETEDALNKIGEYDFKEFRYGEGLLILAEALYEKNGQISDADLDITINQLRKRVNMPALTNQFVTDNGLDMQTEIRRERTVELAFEGYRRDDLRRWGIADEVLPQALRGVKFVGTEYELKYPELAVGQNVQVDENGFILTESASSRKFENKHWYSPIPLKQVQLSKGTLEQNPGWE